MKDLSILMVSTGKSRRCVSEAKPVPKSSDAMRTPPCLSGCRRNAEAFGKGHKFRQRLDLHFLHNPVAMGLDGAFGRTDCAGNVLVGVAANDKVEDLTLTRRQCCDMGADDVQL